MVLSPAPLAIRAQAELELRRRRPRAASAPDDWRGWLETMFPAHVSAGFGPQHEEFWEWWWPVGPDSDPAPFVGIWSRGSGKSSSAELAVTSAGIRRRRRYFLYVRDTQDRADDSVSNVAALFESAGVERDVNRYGASRGWRRNRIRTADGFTVDALGLDVAGRGVKLEDARPDGIVFDDIDGRHDSLRMTEKKTTTITDSLLPAGTDNVAVMMIQNLIIPNGVVSRVADGRADFLAGRIVSGPHPAVRGLVTEKVELPDGSVRTVVVGGEPSWRGQDLAACRRMIDRMGLSAFLRECQHQVQEREGALWTRDILDRERVGSHPPLKRVVVGVDPSGGSDEIGVVVEGLGHDDHVYTLADLSVPGSLGPLAWGRAAVNAYHDYEADRICAEANFGGDMVKSNIKTVDPSVLVTLVRASRGKAVRAEPVATLSEEGRHHMVGAFPELETEMTSWVPGDPDSPNRLDAKVWATTNLRERGSRPKFRAASVGRRSG